MARAHRLSGYDSDEEEDEFEELQEKIANNEDMVRKFYYFFFCTVNRITFYTENCAMKS